MKILNFYWQWPSDIQPGKEFLYPIAFYVKFILLVVVLLEYKSNVKCLTKEELFVVAVVVIYSL